MNNENFTSNDVTIILEDDLCIHLKAITAYGDPVELNSTEAREIAAILLKYAKVLDGES